jgi:hypothetical protein
MVIGPRSETEHAVAAMWEEVVGHRPESIDDEFLSVGGDLAGAGRLLARIHDRWRIRVTLAEFQRASSIARLSGTIERKKAEAREDDLLRNALSGLDALGQGVPAFD